MANQSMLWSSICFAILAHRNCLKVALQVIQAGRGEPSSVQIAVPKTICDTLQFVSLNKVLAACGSAQCPTRNPLTGIPIPFGG